MPLPRLRKEAGPDDSDLGFNNLAKVHENRVQFGIAVSADHGRMPLGAAFGDLHGQRF